MCRHVRIRHSPGGTSGDGVAGGLLGRDGRLGQDLVAVVALVLALGGGGIWALTRSSDPLSMVTAPILQAQQDLSNIGKELAAAPFDANGTTTITSKQLTILRVIADRREALVALNPSSSSSYAAWQVPSPIIWLASTSTAG